jgi:steroid 5-alpha reductase family enzyme
VLLTVYGARLTFNWARGWGGFSHEDWRYAELRKKSGRAYWVVSFLGIHFFPTAMVFLGCLPLFPAVAVSRAAPNWLDGVATVVLAGAVVLEAVADEQMRAFRQAKGAAVVCEVGLWRYSRHPNYLGEILVWVGVFLFGLAAGGPWWHGVGALLMWAMFMFITIPMAERHSLERRPDFAKRKDEVSMLLLWPRTPRKSAVARRCPNFAVPPVRPENGGRCASTGKSCSSWPPRPAPARGRSTRTSRWARRFSARTARSSPGATWRTPPTG